MLAQTRQAERDKIRDAAVQDHRDAQSRRQEEFDAQVRRMLDGDRRREDAHRALLANQSEFIDEFGRALTLVDASATDGAKTALSSEPRDGNGRSRGSSLPD